MFTVINCFLLKYFFFFLQASAILTLLERYGWHSFAIVTGMIAGHRNFDQANFFWSFPVFYVFYFACLDVSQAFKVWFCLFLYIFTLQNILFFTLWFANLFYCTDSLLFYFVFYLSLFYFKILFLFMFAL